DDAWKQVIRSYYQVARREVKRFRGREIDTAGDGFFAAFDAPAEAIRCAKAMVDALWTEGIPIRAGLHTGECERIGNKVGGIAVHIGSRVASLAGPGEIFVTGTTQEMTAGSGIAFDPLGSKELRGVPGDWRVFSVPDTDHRGPLPELEPPPPHEPRKVRSRRWMAAAVAGGVAAVVVVVVIALAVGGSSPSPGPARSHSGAGRTPFVGAFGIDAKTGTPTGRVRLSLAANTV